MIIQPQSREQQIFFSCIDDFVTKDNIVRIIDLLVKTIITKNPEKYTYKGDSYTGRPAYSVETMIKIFIYGYINRITSSRKLEIETKRNLELMWLTGNLQPDFKSIADFRKDNKEIVKQFCKDIKLFLRASNLIDLKQVALDGTKLKANASKDMLKRANIFKNLEALESELEQYLSQIEIQDSIESEQELSYYSTEKDKKISQLEAQITKLKEQLKILEETGKNYISQTDPDCTLMRSRDGSIPGYNVQIMSDSKHHFIVNEYVTDAANDIEELAVAIDSIKSELHEVPEIILADTGYSNLDQIQKIEENNDTTCYIPLPKEAGKSPKSEFIYDIENDRYICSQGKYLTLKQKHKQKRNSFVDIYFGSDCGSCPISEKCTDAKSGRQISRYENDDFRQRHKKKMNSSFGKSMVHKRKSLIEHINGTMKVWLGKIPILTRGIIDVTTEVKLFSSSFNIKRLFNLISFENLKEMIEMYIDSDISKNKTCIFKNQAILKFSYVSLIFFWVISTIFQKI